MAQGGYRQPSNPAPVSGPGALSRRTDGGPTQAGKYIPANGQYGEAKALQELQAAAPMQGNPIPSMPRVTPLNAPTERPSEPVTTGMSFGPGSNTPPEVVNYQDEVAAQIRAAYAMLPNEDLRRLVLALEAEGR